MLRIVLLAQVLIFVFLSLPAIAVADHPVLKGQKALTRSQVNSLQENRKGINDFYFIGFAPYSTEDVFMNEATYVRNLFDLQYDTLNRSILMVNNPKSLNLYPAATLNNLDTVFKKIGSLINPDEDIVVLYITSHGEKELGVSLKFENAGELAPEKKYLDAESLLHLFDENNIKWRIIFILSCYSGGFIDKLKNEYTLIITSASKERPSFGCGHHGDFTQFGEVMFRNRLSKSSDFITSFDLARLEVEKLEKSMDLKPSEPQIFVGDKIRLLLEKVIQ